jgi:hypothetical protein
MEDALLIAQLDPEVGLYVSELSSATLSENGLTGHSGLFLYEAVDRLAASGIRILAQVADVEAAHRLAQVFHRTPVSL